MTADSTALTTPVPMYLGLIIFPHFTSWQSNVAELILALWKGYRPLRELLGCEETGLYVSLFNAGKTTALE